MVRLRAFASIGLSLVALSGLARADFPSVDVRQFQPPTDPAGSMYLEPAATPGPWAFNAAAWVSYAWRPAVLRNSEGNIVTKLLSYQLTSDIIGNIGLGTRGAFGFDLPLLLSQSGERDVNVAALAPGADLAQQGLGDLALVGKGNFIAAGSLAGFGLSGILRVTAPTGKTTSYLGEGAPTTELRLLAELRLVALALETTAGFKLRFEERDVIGRTYANEIPWGVGLVVRPQAFGWDEKGRWMWVAEMRGSAMLPPSDAAEARGQKRASSPVVAALSARMAFGNFSALLGVQTALSDALGNAPFQVTGSFQWEPRAHDMDHDGVRDDVDQCSELAEDRDGFQDADGCPDWDNDDDGVGDGEDRCPAEKEDTDGFQDADGCPDLDNDGDGIPDAEDACPNVAGERRDKPKRNGCPRKAREEAAKVDSDHDGIPDAEDMCPNDAGDTPGDPKRHGCPIPDKDGDTIEDWADKCPGDAEVYNGVEDADGCPDAGGKPLVTIDDVGGAQSARFSRPLKWKTVGEALELEPEAWTSLRALGLELNLHPTWIAAVGVRPKNGSAEAQQAALGQAFAIADILHRLTHRDGVAETVGWQAVEKRPGAKAAGLGILILPAEKPPSEKPPPDKPPADNP
jgi:OmpA-OmpF porin, OOP family